MFAYCLSFLLIPIAVFAFEGTFYFNMRQNHLSYNKSYNNSHVHKRSNPPLLSPVRHTHNKIRLYHKTIVVPHNTHNATTPTNTAITATHNTNELSAIPTQLITQWQQELATNTNPTTANRLILRINALSYKQITTTTGPPYIHQNTAAFAHRYNIDLHDLNPTKPPLIAHILYKEYVDILQKASCISKQHNEIILDALGQASGIGLEANKAGFVEQASKLADFCWTVLDYTKAVGEGVYLGATNTLHTLTHPIETAKNALIGIGVIAYGLSKTIDTMNFMREAPFLYIADNDRFFLRYNAIIDQLQTITDEANKYFSSTSARDLVKQGAAFATEGILLAKTFTLAQNIFHRILPVAEFCFEFITIEEPLACLVNGELVTIKMPKGMDIGSLEGSILKMENNQLPTQIRNGLTPPTHSVEEISIAIAEIETNRINHILTPKTGKHAWDKIITGEVAWEKVKSLIGKIMLEGVITKVEENIITKSLNIFDKVIDVKYIVLNDTFSIVNAWVRK